MPRLRAVGVAVVEINENLARLRADARADDPAILNFVHDARGAAVAEFQAALQERDAGYGVSCTAR